MRANISEKQRWMFLIAATISMMVVGLYQYSWTLFVNPIQEELGWSLDIIQITFTLSIWVMTWIQPVAGFIADKKGPKQLNLLGGLLAGFGWFFASFIDTPIEIYIAYSLGSIGVGLIYASSIGLACKWFPDKRGVANGFASFGYGFGAAILNPIISSIINSLGFRSAFAYLGIGILGILLVLGLFVRYPPSDWFLSQTSVEKNSLFNVLKVEKQFTPKEMVKTKQWWQIYIAFFLTVSTGLMITSQLTAMSQVFEISQHVVIAATMMFPIVNGVGRLLGGWVSDRLGRELTMTCFCGSQGVSTLLLFFFGTNDIVFLLMICIIGLFWGPIFTFFPSIITDYYGHKNSTTNYGLTYTAKAWGGLIGGYVVAWLAVTYGGFGIPILISMIFSFASTLLVFPQILKKPNDK